MGYGSVSGYLCIGEKMRVAITSKGTNLESEVDPRFGRAQYLIIADTESREYEVLDNSENINAFKGAGIKAASMVSRKDVDALLTGYCGPKAFKTLAAAGVKVVNDVEGTVAQALDLAAKGSLNYASDANVEAHW
jgi:predicted Fe-Mo cluster-binding NifX family protein